MDLCFHSLISSRSIVFRNQFSIVIISKTSSPLHFTQGPSAQWGRGAFKFSEKCFECDDQYQWRTNMILSGGMGEA